MKKIIIEIEEEDFLLLEKKAIANEFKSAERYMKFRVMEEIQHIKETEAIKSIKETLKE